MKTGTVLDLSYYEVLECAIFTNWIIVFEHSLSLFRPPWGAMALLYGIEDEDSLNLSTEKIVLIVFIPGQESILI